MLKSAELPDCFYVNKPILITPNGSTPKHSLYLTNLDDQKFLRFSIKYLYLFRKGVSVEKLKCSLSRVLNEYYPLAGRLRTSKENDHKLEVECNGEGALFVESFMDITAQEFLDISNKPNKSWRKLLYKVEAPSLLDIPPLVVQVTNLRCGGMILCTAINHCLCDGIGSSQFLHAWAHLIRNPTAKLPLTPCRFCHVLKPRTPPQVKFSHPGFTKTPTDHYTLNINQYLLSQPLLPASIKFTSTQILHLKKQCAPTLKCTTFEVVAAHTWRCWVKSLDLPSPINVKLLFSVNIRKKLKPELPQGYYGNGFVLGCAESNAKNLVTSNLHHGVKLVQQAKATLDDEYVKSIIDLFEDKTVRTDLSTSLVISQWSKFGLEELDFGEGKPLHMGSVTSDIYCLFLPVVGEIDAVRVLVSMPESIIQRFEHYMTDFSSRGGNGDTNGECGGEEKGVEVVAF